MSIHKINQSFLVVLLSIFVVNSVHAQEKKDDQLLKSLSYPELEVVPRASERLKMEAKNERSHRWKSHLPLQVSALTTLVAGYLAYDNPKDGASQAEIDNNDWASQAGMIIGGGWLLTTTWMSAQYKPYQKAYRKIKKMSSGSQKEQLARERIAEEALYAPARLASRLKYMSIVTNALASGYIITSGDENTTIMGAVSLLAALSPLVFDSRWIEVADQHRQYKKKIYGPVSRVMAVPGKSGMELVPAIGIAASF